MYHADRRCADTHFRAMPTSHLFEVALAVDGSVVVNEGVEDLASFKPSSCDFVMRYYWGGNKTSKHMLVALQLPHLLVCFSML